MHLDRMRAPRHAACAKRFPNVVASGTIGFQERTTGYATVGNTVKH
jgi:hypothetical protein